MRDHEKHQIKQQLQAEIDETSTTIKSLEEQTKPIPPDNAIGRLTRMEAINNRAVAVAALASAKAKLQQLQNMLSRIDQSDFGRCSICHQPISLERLKVLPESDRCVRCAS